MQDALVILPGITADKRKRAFVKAHFARHTPYVVYLPPLHQRLGLDRAARCLARDIARLRDAPKIHFVCYISGGFILRRMHADRPLERAGRVVFVRSPLQEEVPRLVLEKKGRIAAYLAGGRMLFDLAQPRKDSYPIPESLESYGVLMERGLSAAASGLGLRQDQYERLKEAGPFEFPDAADITEIDESHDDVYTSTQVLDRITVFIRTGHF